jgi:hypothetical protein
MVNTCKIFRGVFFLLLLAFVVSCGSDNDKDKDINVLVGEQPASESTETSNKPTPTPISEVGSEELFAGISYEVMYIHNGTLFHLTSRTNQPEAIESNVHPASLYLSPDYSTVLYGIQNTEVDVQRLGIVNLATMETTPIELPEGDVYMPTTIHGWSADSQWVFIAFSPLNDKVIVLNLRTGKYIKVDWYDEDERPGTLLGLWLTDNRILFYRTREIIDGVAPGLNGVIIDTYIFNPATGEETPITLNAEALNALALRLSPSALNSLDKTP